MERLLKLEHMMGIKVRDLMSFIDKKCQLEKLLKMLENDGGKRYRALLFLSICWIPG